MTNLLTHNCVYVCVQQGGVTKVANKGCKGEGCSLKVKGGRGLQMDEGREP